MEEGNYSLGLKGYNVFPEIQYKDVVKDYGLQVVMVTSAENDAEASLLLKSFGFPFKKES